MRIAFESDGSITAYGVDIDGVEVESWPSDIENALKGKYLFEEGDFVEVDGWEDEVKDPADFTGFGE